MQIVHNNIYELRYVRTRHRTHSFTKKAIHLSFMFSNFPEKNAEQTPPKTHLNLIACQISFYPYTSGTTENDLIISALYNYCLHLLEIL